MKELGENKAIVKICYGLTEKQKREFIIKDNYPVGEWDFDILANEWNEQELIEWGTNILTYTFDVDVNNLKEDDLDLSEKFDPIGVSKGLTKIIIILDNDAEAQKILQKKTSN